MEGLQPIQAILDKFLRSESNDVYMTLEAWMGSDGIATCLLYDPDRFLTPDDPLFQHIKQEDI